MVSNPSLITLGLFALCFIGVTRGRSQSVPKPTKSLEAMAKFERLIGGEWRQTAASGQSMFHTWHWGPGKHSIRRITDGFGADGKPWRELQIFARDPLRNQIRVLGMSPYAHGLSEGSITFDGDSAEIKSDLFQSGGVKRVIVIRWKFKGDDRYQEELLEVTGKGVLTPLVQFDMVRVKPPTVPRSKKVDGAKALDHFKSLTPLFGTTWEAQNQWFNGDAFKIRTTIEWMPMAEAISICVIEPSTAGKPSKHLLDADLYHHTGNNKLRCLVLTHTGGLFEGDVQIDHREPRRVDLVGGEGQLDSVLKWENDKSIHQQTWSKIGARRTLLLDFRHTKSTATVP